MFYIINFYRENLLAPRPTSEFEYHPLSAVSECLFHTFAATLHIWYRCSSQLPFISGTVVPLSTN